MKLFLFIIIAVLTSTICTAQSNTKAWTKSYEKEVYDAMYKVASSIFNTNEQKIDYSNYCVNKLEEKFPNGIDNVPDDSLKNAMYSIGASYTRQTKDFKLKAWTPQYEALIKGYLVNNPALNGINDKSKIFFCDCYVNNLKILYPNGVVQTVPKDIQIKVTNICMDEIKKSAERLKH